MMSDPEDVPSSGGSPSTLDLSQIKEVKPPPIRQEPMPHLQKHGVRLAWGVLGGIGIFGVILLVCVAVNEFGSPPREIETAIGMAQQSLAHCAQPCDPESVQKVSDLLAKIAEAKRASRDFWTSFSQFILLNLLLPVLTSILGYVFGTTKKDS